MTAYIYQAELLCAECASRIKADLKVAGKEPTPQEIADRLVDSDDWPDGPYPNGGGESDCPQHCGGCGVFLENPLTGEGVEYALAKAEEECAKGPEHFNRIVPLKGTAEETATVYHGSPHKAIVLDWLKQLQWYRLSDADSERLNKCLEILEN